MGLGARSSKSSVKGSIRATSTSYNVIPYGGGHIPRLSPSLDSAFQQPVGPSTNYVLFGAGSLGPSSYTTLVGSMSFSLFCVFRNNDFSSAVISARGNPGFGQHNHVHGIIPTQGASTGVFSSQGLWNPWQGSVPSQGMSTGGNCRNFNTN
jgi:hypothetical protein